MLDGTVIITRGTPVLRVVSCVTVLTDTGIATNSPVLFANTGMHVSMSLIDFTGTEIFVACTVNHVTVRPAPNIERPESCTSGSILNAQRTKHTCLLYTSPSPRDS